MVEPKPHEYVGTPEKYTSPVEPQPLLFPFPWGRGALPRCARACGVPVSGPCLRARSGGAARWVV